MQEDREQLLKALENIRVFFDARADMAVGDAKIIFAGYDKAIAAAIELVKAQEPLPAKIEGSNIIQIGRCPACGKVMVPWGASHCQECGQAVTWGTRKGQ